MPMAILMLLLEFPSDLPLVLTPSPKDLMPLPKELLPMPTMAMVLLDITMARGLLTLMPSMPMAILMLLLEFPSDLPLVLTPSPKDLMPLPKELLPMPTMALVSLDITMARGLLTLMP